MQDGRVDTKTILELTSEIEAARLALRDGNTVSARRRLTDAEDAYRTYLMGLSGLDGGCRLPTSPP